MDNVQVSGLSSSANASNSSRNASNVASFSGIYTPSTNVDAATPDIIQSQTYDFGAFPQMEPTVTYFIIQNHQDIYALGVTIAPRT